jgi:hypothetical protein
MSQKALDLRNQIIYKGKMSAKQLIQFCMFKPRRSDVLDLRAFVLRCFLHETFTVRIRIYLYDNPGFLVLNGRARNNIRYILSERRGI